jgi:Flp pilus assembly protein TadG
MKMFRFGDNRGSALVEIAISAPLFMVLTMGAVELGRIAYFAIEVQNAARAGASFGSVNKNNSNDITDITQIAKNDAPDVSDLIVVSPGEECVCESMTTSSKSPTFYPTSGAPISCTDSHITSCTVENSSTVDSVLDYVTVSTSASVDPLVHIPGLPNKWTLSGFSALRVLEN